jgi:hypothetical protein
VANQPVRLRAAALSATVSLALIGGCAPLGRDLTPLDPGAQDMAATDGPSEVDGSAGAVGPGAEDFIDPAHDSGPVLVPATEPTGLPDLAEQGLSSQDEAAALSAAQDFVHAIWTWDYTDHNDRAGLERALPLTTPQLAEQLAGYLTQTLYDPAEWDRLSAIGAVGSASQVLSVAPAPDGDFDADHYTAQVIYRTFTVDEQGAYLAREEEARYATLQLARVDGAWLVAAIPHLQAEHVIETAPR